MDIFALYIYKLLSNEIPLLYICTLLLKGRYCYMSIIANLLK